MLSILLSVVVASIPSAHAFLSNAKMPVCMDGSKEMEIDNEQVLSFKKNTQNNFHARGFVKGIVAEDPVRRNGHDHFAITLGSGKDDRIEIVYNPDDGDGFGPMPELHAGDEMIVCGDYITSYQQTGRYPASPEGALIHWSHWNPANRASSMDHEHGFVMVGSTLVGFDAAPDAAWDGTVGDRSGPARSGSNRGNR